MKILRSMKTLVSLALVTATVSGGHAQEIAPDDVRPAVPQQQVLSQPQVVAQPQPPAPPPPQVVSTPLDLSIPLFVNPSPGVFVPVTFPVAAKPVAPAYTGMPRYAFVVELRVGGGGIVAGTGTTGVLAPSVFLGARLAGRVHLGLSFGLTRVSLGENNFNNDNDEDSTSTIFDIEPTASIDLVQARDRRVALYFKAGVPLGAYFQTDVAREPVVGYDFALGVRYLPHPMFGIGFEGGVNGIYVHPTNDDYSSVTIVYGAIVGTFFAGK